MKCLFGGNTVSQILSPWFLIIFIGVFDCLLEEALAFARGVELPVIRVICLVICPA